MHFRLEGRELGETSMFHIHKLVVSLRRSDVEVLGGRSGGPPGVILPNRATQFPFAPFFLP